MPSLSTLPVFIAASIALLVIPGPAVLFIVARSGAQGTRAGLVSVLGVHTASVVHVLAAVAGLSAVIVASSVAFTAVKLVGGRICLPGHPVDPCCSPPDGRSTLRHTDRSARATHLRGGLRHQPVQPEGRPVLPGVPAAVRRGRPRRTVDADARARRRLHRARPVLGQHVRAARCPSGVAVQPPLCSPACHALRRGRDPGGARRADVGAATPPRRHVRPRAGQTGPRSYVATVHPTAKMGIGS